MKGNTHTRRNHFSYLHTTELYTEHNHSGKGPETTADLHSLLTSQQQSQTQNKATGWRLTVKRLFSRSRKIFDLKFYINCSETHRLQKLNHTFRRGMFGVDVKLKSVVVSNVTGNVKPFKKNIVQFYRRLVMFTLL